MPRQERRRAVSALVTILFSVFILVAPLVAMAIAQGSPQITLWNPSDYSNGAQDAPLIVSDAKTGDDESEEINETTYRLMATSKNTPNPALVEFELVQGTVLNITIGTAVQKGPDAWEYDWDIPASVTDGQYTIRAILYQGSGVTAVEVDRDEQPVLIRSGNAPGAPPPAPAADITYPLNGDQVGFYTDPITGATNTVINAEFALETTYIEALYTVSDPGDEPVWKSCAGPTTVATTDFPVAGSISLRCTLESQDQGGQSVTGLGVVSNNSPNDPFDFAAGSDPNLNTAGDSIRVLPYEQDAVSLTTDDQEVRHDGANGTTCSPTVLVTAIDQNGKPIAGINVDVHARGPSDQLKFRVNGRPLTQGAPYAVKTPDKAHSGTEPGYACAQTGNNQQFATTRQGDHNVAGGPDVKHIESSGSQTDNSGRFGVQVRTDINGTSQLTFWVDEDNDDQFCSNEPSALAAVGFNVPAAPAAGETPVVSDCPIPTPPPPGGNPSSGPSPTDTGSPGDCTHTGTAGDDNIVGSQGNDVICAGDGDDSVDGRGGDDIILGEGGDDLLDGDIGDDTIDSGPGNDRVDGGPDNDLLDGRAGVDVLVGNVGDDTIRGQAGVDGLQGGAGRDVLQGGSGDDVADAQAGNDILKGFIGEDILRGGGGKDSLRGMNQDDQLTGGGGNDNISGGRGRDQCSGGSGRDKLRKCER